MDGRLSINLNSAADNGHTHRKYTKIITTPTSTVMLPTYEYFVINHANDVQSVLQDPVQVYVCGILQTNGIHFEEILDTNLPENGIGIDFMEEVLEPGYVVTLEWTLKV
jgi:hypothetical protein